MRSEELNSTTSAGPGSTLAQHIKNKKQKNCGRDAIHRQKRSLPGWPASYRAPATAPGRAPSVIPVSGARESVTPPPLASRPRRHPPGTRTFPTRRGKQSNQPLLCQLCPHHRPLERLGSRDRRPVVKTHTKMRPPAVVLIGGTK